MTAVPGNENLETSMMKEGSTGTMATVTAGEKMAPKSKAEPRKESLRVRNCEYLYTHKTGERVIYLNIKLIIFNYTFSKRWKYPAQKALKERQKFQGQQRKKKMQAKCVLDNTISKNKENDD